MPATLSNTDLAVQRTILAHERTVIAWMRTAISLISFGFTIYKFFNEQNNVSEEHTLLSPRVIGMIMICFGLLGLLLAEIQHRKAIAKIKLAYPDITPSLSSVMTILTLLFGLLLFIAALFRQ